MRELIGRHARLHGETGAYAKPKQWFPPRSLVGMTHGARKRAAWHSWPTVERSFFRIGERLRPCLGCPKCGPGSPVRFGSLPRYVVVFLSGASLYASADLSSAWLAERTADGFQKHSIPSLATFNRKDRVRIIDSGTHCDGSGLLPARSRK